MAYDILHFSVRPRFWGKSGFQPTGKDFLSPYAQVNIVFRYTPDEENGYNSTWAKVNSSEYDCVYAANSIEDIEDYQNNIVMEFEEPENDSDNGIVRFSSKNGKSYRDVFKKMYTSKSYTLLRYHEKFDVYQYREYLEWNPATIGILHHIELMRNNYGNSQYTNNSIFERCIEALDKFWH